MAVKVPRQPGIAALVFACGLASAVVSVVAVAPAQAQDTGIAVERFTPAAGPGAFAQVESAPVPLPAQIWLTGALLGIGRPLVLRNAVTGDQVSLPVANRVTLDLGGEIGIWRQRLSVGIGVPLSVWQNGDRLQLTGAANGGAGTGAAAGDVEAPLQTTALGDIRLRAKARLTSLESAASLAMLLEVTIPAGGQHDFIATSSMTVAPRLLGSFRRGWLVGALNLGLRFLPQRFLYGTALHNQFEWGAALGFVLPVRRVGVALYSEAAGQLNLVSPGYESGTEFRAALRLGWFRGAVDLGAAGGFGALAPQWRAFLLLRMWFGESGVTGCLTKPVTF